MSDRLFRAPAPSKAVGDSQAYSSLTGRPSGAGMVGERIGASTPTDVQHVPSADGGKNGK